MVKAFGEENSRMNLFGSKSKLVFVANFDLNAAATCILTFFAPCELFQPRSLRHDRPFTVSMANAGKLSKMAEKSLRESSVWFQRSLYCI